MKNPTIMTPILNALDREVFIARTYSKLLARNFSKYGKIASLLYFIPALGIKSVMKPAYFFCRTIDDMADGDAPLPAEIPSFKALTDHLIELIEKKVDSKYTLDFLLMDAIKKMKIKEAREDNIAQDFVRFIKAMQAEHERRMHQKVLSKDGIHTLYEHSFSQVINLALIGLGSKNRIDEMSSLGPLQGKIYAIQDLEQELRLGIINIPQEVIEASGLTKEGIIENPKTASTNEIVVQWIKDELFECKQHIEILKSTNLDRTARMMVNFLVGPLETFIDTYSMKVRV